MRSIFLTVRLLSGIVLSAQPVLAGPDWLQPEAGPLALTRIAKQDLSSFERFRLYRGFDDICGVIIETNDELVMVIIEKIDVTGAHLRNVTVPRGKEWDKPKITNQVLSRELGIMISKLWEIELKKVRYSAEASRVVDGVIYHFYTFLEREERELSGVAISVGNPAKAPSLANFLDIATTLWLVSRSDDTADTEHQKALEELKTLVTTRLGASRE